MLRKFTSLVIILALLTVTIIPSDAGWVDDWLTQKTSVSPSTLKGQKRGYFTAGSFSARWPTSSDRLINFTPPHIKFGCGGIDVFMGSLGFLQPEYLIQKLESIISAAPAFAFDIALKTLCEECSTVMKALENLANQLNSLQLDECKMSKTLAVKFIEGLGGSVPAADKAEADQTINMLENAFKVPQGWKDDVAKNGYTPTTKVDEALQGCPQDVKDIFVTEGSVLAHISAKMSVSAPYIDLIRGFIGDVKIKNNSGDAVPMSPCGQNDPQRVDDFVTGKAHQQNSAGNCSPITDVNANLYDYTFKKIKDAYDAIKTKQGTLDEDFFKHIPLPVILALKAAVQTGADDTAIAQLSEITAKEYAYMIMADLYAKMGSMIHKADEIVANGGYNPTSCRTELIEGAVKETRKLAEKARVFANNLAVSAERTISANLAVIDLSRRYEEWYKLAQEESAKRMIPALRRY